MNQRQHDGGPLPEAERIELVDVLRGFALCGILFVNIMWFKAPGGFPGIGYEETPLNRAAVAAVTILAQGKFFTLFSFLFGWGFATQFLRAEARGATAGFAPLFLRRLLILGLIGAVHAVLLSEGDFLLLYALVGLLLLPLRSTRPEILLRWAKWILALLAAVWLLMFGALALGRAFPDGAEEIAASDRELEESFRSEGQATTAAYLDRAPVRVVAKRIENYGRNAWILLLLGPVVLAMFLLGVAAGRNGLLHRASEHQVLLRRIRNWGLVIGLPLALLCAAGLDRLPTLSALVCLQLNSVLAGPLLALAYCASITRLWQRPHWQRWLRPLAPLGRMALTNYLLQSLIANVLFYGYGLGLARRVSPSLALLIVLAILAGQLVISGWWLRRYRFGPVEWLWRALTYGRREPLRRTAG